ncbi:hypothetical protein [Spirosoma sp. KNUC1025]|uniref:hypothetical protein n=1 Tax=Spirosoma sp. KNUC1025 TaxID=2894082 RepID=UPI00386CCFCD|nr:hypothetical protein LN737_05160 [Spirosoma sp. KNUC1025]
MKRTDKLKVLQDAMQGQTSTLQQLKRQQAKEAMPYLEVAGIINVHDCPPALLDKRVMFSYFPTLHKKEQFFLPVREYLQHYAHVEPRLKFLFGHGLGLLYANNSLYDSVGLDFMEFRCRDYRERYREGGTIGDLRRWYRNTAKSCDGPGYIALWFENDLKRFDWHRQRLLTPES